MKQSARFLSLLASAVLLLTSALQAATPASGTINTPSDDALGTKQTITFFGGPLAISSGFTNYSFPSCNQSAAGTDIVPPGVCDVFVLSINLPANYYETHAGNVTAHLTWTTPDGTDPSLDDVGLFIVDSHGNAVASSDDTNATAAGGTGRAEETAVASNLPAGNYKIIILNSLSPLPIPRYDVTVTFNLTQKPAPPPPQTKIFDNYTPPVVNGTQLGRTANEPSIGVNWKTGNVMFLAGLTTFRVGFDDTTAPATANWSGNVGSTITSRISLDPILFTDAHTGRTFVSQLMAACSLMAFTDDDGANWFQNPVGCGVATFVDHQTVGGGPFPFGTSATDPVFNYRNSVQYCAQDVASAQCAVSMNGGITFGLGTPVYLITDCGGLHGHIRTAPDGTLYLPNKDCGGEIGLHVSTDSGASWTKHTVPGTLAANSDPWVDVAPDGTVYLGWIDGDHTPMMGVSHDRGANWTTRSIGAEHNIQNAVFASVVAGDSDRAAFAFIGTDTGGDLQGATFQGVWHLYVAYTYNGGDTWTTYNATPGDPVQRGCIWLGGGDNPCRNLLDFMGITLDKQGRVLVGYADGCIDDPLPPVSDPIEGTPPPNRCVSAPPADAQDAVKTKLATIARQSGGLPLFAANDGLFATVPGAPVLSGLEGNNVNRLTWTTPSNGGAAITGYKVYRGTSSGGETLLTSVGAVNSFDDTGVTNGTTYYYRVSAVNAKGEGSTSNEVALKPAFKAAPSAPQRLKASAKKGGVMLTWSAPADQGTAPVTGYRVYRSAAPGLETFLVAVGNTTHYSDEGLASGATYYYKVTAVNAVGESPKSNEDSARVK
jgi:hypothetical protein